MKASVVDSVVVVGRDAPVWLAAAAMRTALKPAGVQVSVVELPSLLSSSDCYASLPALEALHHRLGLDEPALLSMAGGSFSLGQNFIDTTRAVAPFFHAYGAYGAPIDHKAFLPHWLLARAHGLQVALEEFSLTAAAAKHGRMLIPDAATQTYGRTDYGYHLPAIDYARVLKTVALRRGVTAYQASAIETELHPLDGSIAALVLGSGQRVSGQLFIDASGAQSQLLGTALRASRASWREWFPANRRLTTSFARLSSIPPYAEVRAWEQGWLAVFPTQSLTHITQVFASDQCSDEAAVQAAARISSAHLHDAVLDASDPGRFTVAWDRNCVAVGEAACVFDPVHSVDLQALQVELVHLLSLFPVSSEFGIERAEYNRTVAAAYERLRDFQSAHYMSNRYAGEFWDRARGVTISPELEHKLALFQARGELPMLEEETFSLDSWQALLIGHAVMPTTLDLVVDDTPPERMKQEFRRILAFIKDKVQEQTSHDFYLGSVCARRSFSP